MFFKGKYFVVYDLCGLYLRGDVDDIDDYDEYVVFGVEVVD